VKNKRKKLCIRYKILLIKLAVKAYDSNGKVERVIRKGIKKENTGTIENNIRILTS
jgi:hypothetical protein